MKLNKREAVIIAIGVILMVGFWFAGFSIGFTTCELIFSLTM